MNISLNILLYTNLRWIPASIPENMTISFRVDCSESRMINHHHSRHTVFSEGWKELQKKFLKYRTLKNELQNKKTVCTIFIFLHSSTPSNHCFHYMFIVIFILPWDKSFRYNVLMIIHLLQATSLINLPHKGNVLYEKKSWTWLFYKLKAFTTT